MTNLLNLFANNLLPIFIVSGAGFFVGKRLQISARPISQLVFYIFSPCLIFNLITQSKLGGGDILRIVGLSFIIMLLVGLIVLIAGLILKLERRMLAAVLLTSILMNAGNYGMPVVGFAFGDIAQTYAALYFVGLTIMTYSLGVVIASLGTKSLREALLGLLKIPVIYSVVISIVFVATGWKLPVPLQRTVDLLANATIPCMLVVLGLQFQVVRWSGQIKPLALAISARMLLAPLLAIGFCLLFGIQGAARQSGIIESAMPAAVMSTVLATEYNVEPAFVTLVVFVGTLISPLILTPLMAWLGA